ncbi:MAG: hypothetical protein N2560_01905 [Ignavibacteria bacterium]|nr:hypothetical protein [Ignavibacteria bacterium]
MKDKQLFEEMVNILKSLGYKIRKDSGSFGGGACVLQDEKIVVLNRNLPLEVHLSILANVLSNHQSEIFIQPRVRDFIEQERQKVSPLIEIIINKP